MYPQVFPDEVPDMKESVLKLYYSLKQLAAFIFRLMAIALKLKVRIVFYPRIAIIVKQYKKINSK